MTTSTQSNFQLCSVISKENGETPIGSASNAGYWLLIEVRAPWPRNVWDAKTLPPALVKAVETVRSSDLNIKALGIEPDKEYSKRDHTRVMLYHRPNQPFARFEKAEYVVPDEMAPDLVEALFADSKALIPFMTYRQDTNHIREMFVCTHGSRDVCCGQQGFPLYDLLRKMNPAQAKMPVRAWRVSHIGGHKFAATLADFPYGQMWGHFEIPVLPNLIEMSGSVETLMPFYRGWAGGNKFIQIAEREVWAQEGWAWLDYEKQGEMLSQDEAGQWAEVRLDFRSPDGQRSGAYFARIEVSGQVQTLAKSGRGELVSVDQYRVTRLECAEEKEVNLV